jgi:hypothetical protein
MPDEDTTETTDSQTSDTTRDASTADDYAELKASIKKERDARRALEREATELRKFKQDQETAKLSETEKLQNRIKELEAKESHLTTRERSIAVRDGLTTAAAAEKLGLVASSATVLRLIDLDSVEFDAAGTPTNLGGLLKQLAKDEPALFEQRRRAGSADGGTGGDRAPLNMNDLIRRAAGRG